MKNCIVKIIDNVFEKNDGGGLFPLMDNDIRVAHHMRKALDLRLR